MEMNIERYQELIEIEKKYKLLDDEYGTLFDELQETKRALEEKEKQITRTIKASKEMAQEYEEDIARLKGIIDGWRQAIETIRGWTP